MRRHLPCLALALVLALVGGGVGCCSRDVREASGELRAAGVSLAASTGKLEAAWRAFLAASAPRADLDEADAASWAEVASEVTDALQRQREAALQVQAAAAAAHERAGGDAR